MRCPYVIVAWLAATASVHAGAPAPIPHPVECAFCVPVFVTRTVTSIEKELVDAAPQPGAAAVGHRIALVKIGKRLAGAGNHSRARATDAAVNAVSVAAPSSVDNPASVTELKSLRSSDLGGLFEK